MGLSNLVKKVKESDSLNDIFHRKQELAKESGSVYYGGIGTIHQTGEVNVELDKSGKVVSVWFRCQMLPFTQRVVEDYRAAEMRHAYENNGARPLSGVEIVEINDSSS